MEDSSLFMQWAVSTLQQEHPPPPATPAVPCYDHGGDTFSPLLDSIVPGEPPAQEGHRSSTGCSSGDSADSGSGGGSSVVPVPAIERDGWSPSRSSAKRAAPPSGSSSSSATNQPVSWNFVSASASPRPSYEAMPNSAARAEVIDGGVVVPQTAQHGSPPAITPARASGSSPPASSNSHHHIMAERKRREKLNVCFIELSTVIPGLKKMDKATILSDATRYVKELQEKLKAHEDGRSRSVESTASVPAVKNKKPCIAAADGEDGRPPSCAAAGGSAVTRTGLPEIEAKISDGNVMLKIHCDDGKGVAVKVLAEVEELQLSIVHANVMPFPVGTLIINIMAKVEGLNTTAEAIVGSLNSALLKNSRNSTRDEARGCY